MTKANTAVVDYFARYGEVMSAITFVLEGGTGTSFDYEFASIATK